MQKGKHLCLFMDNASIHTSRKAQEALEQMQLHAILNVPYRPQYNSIEFVWAMCKKLYRK